jgi:putative ABC transport system ATP-binding protein
MMALVEIRKLTKEFSKGDAQVRPLDAIDLTIEERDFVSLMGASGSGKSTLLNLLTGIDRPTSGQILVNGTDIAQLSRRRLADWRAANIGYIFQTHNLVPVLTAYENIELPLLLLPLSAAERRKRVTIALDAVDLGDRAHYYPRQLSGGQEQRVGIARAIVAHPAIVVADEPTGNLDSRAAQQIVDLIERLNAELGMTVFVVTHDAKVAGIAARRLRLEDGKLLESAKTPPVLVHGDQRRA